MAEIKIIKHRKLEIITNTAGEPWTERYGRREKEQVKELRNLPVGIQIYLVTTNHKARHNFDNLLHSSPFANVAF